MIHMNFERLRKRRRKFLWFGVIITTTLILVLVLTVALVVNNSNQSNGTSSGNSNETVALQQPSNNGNANNNSNTPTAPTTPQPITSMTFRPSTSPFLRANDNGNELQNEDDDGGNDDNETPASPSLSLFPTFPPNEEDNNKLPTKNPSTAPITLSPSASPNTEPHTATPSVRPTLRPTEDPTRMPTKQPTPVPTTTPTHQPSHRPTRAPTARPTNVPTPVPTPKPTPAPTTVPTRTPTVGPTAQPTPSPTPKPTTTPTSQPTQHPSSQPTLGPSSAPTQGPTPSLPEKPSFLFMLVDDVGWADFSYNGGNAKTPNIDEWARRSGSRVFHDFHSGGSVCSPTRASVLTGRNHFRDCVSSTYACRDNLECRDLDYEFAPQGTFTVADAVGSVAEYNMGCGVFFSGKWHLGNFYEDAASFGGITSSPTTHGFQCFAATIGNAATRTPNCHCEFGAEISPQEQQCDIGYENRERDQVCANYWYDDPMAEHGVTNMTQPTPPSDAHFMAKSFATYLSDRREAGLPFLAQVSFRNCHKPFLGSAPGREDCANGLTCHPAIPRRRPYTMEELDYYACLVELDAAVGEILQALDETGYYNNTMVWFASDNGPEGGCGQDGICDGDDPNRPPSAPGTAGQLRGRKRDVYEGGHRVPGIISFPDLLQGNQVIWELAVTHDFLPTVMDILKVPRPLQQQSWALDGRSLLPILDGGLWADTEEGQREVGFGFAKSNSDMTGWGFRMGKWKLVVENFGCTVEDCFQSQLFNLENDLGERNNLASTRIAMRRKMENKLRDWVTSLEASREMESLCRVRAPWQIDRQWANF
mmetsp:Transcript_2165/g.4374  ORF Transcript_2165/g.4374 Transcript_2165/m.4374 type:complete len:817 (+) Transcript_2165:442-2892(+)